MAKTLYYYIDDPMGPMADRRRYHARVGACRLAMNLAETGKMFRVVLTNTAQLDELARKIGHPPVCAACGEPIIPLPKDTREVDSPLLSW